MTTKLSLLTRSAALTLCGALLACGAIGDLLPRKHTSPFTLFGRDDMRAGMRFETLEKQSSKESRFRYECSELWAKARRCSHIIEPGALVAVVDSTGRVVRLSMTPDARIRGGQNVSGQLLLRDVVRDMSAAWDSIAPGRRESGDETPPQRRWVAGGGRWAASLWYAPAQGMSGAVRSERSDAELAIALPDSLGITDLPAYAVLMRARPAEPPPPRPRLVVARERSEPAPPKPEDIVAMMRSDLRELTIAQEGVLRNTGSYEPTLERLHVSSSAGVRLELMKSTGDGWSAVATHPSLPGKSCVVFAGFVNAPPRTRKAALRGTPGEVVCDEP